MVGCGEDPPRHPLRQSRNGFTTRLFIGRNADPFPARTSLFCNCLRRVLRRRVSREQGMGLQGMGCREGQGRASVTSSSPSGRSLPSRRRRQPVRLEPRFSALCIAILSPSIFNPCRRGSRLPGALAAALDGLLVRDLAHQIESEVADHRHVFGAMTDAQA